MKCIAPKCDKTCTLGAIFCSDHLQAPAGQRGGWISAERRRRARGGGDVSLDASNIVRRLWVGSKPPFDRPLPGVDVLVLCAREIQPRGIASAHVILRVPLPDSALSELETATAIMGGRQLARHLAAGRTALVTCAMGLNRSALVASIALGCITRMSADQIIDLIRSRRSSSALSNSHFVKLLHDVIGDGR